jgi:hypothetical protein
MSASGGGIANSKVSAFLELRFAGRPNANLNCDLGGLGYVLERLKDNGSRIFN